MTIHQNKNDNNMDQIEQQIENERITKQIAEGLGWTDIHGGVSDGGMYLRGLPPGSKRGGPMEMVPNFHAAAKGTLRWHKLNTVMIGDKVMEVLAATFRQGKGMIVRWNRVSLTLWFIEAMDTETEGWFAIDGDEWNDIPEAPPVVWDDLPELPVKAAAEPAEPEPGPWS
jgi:hypothetical protein